jgi:DNA/RNA-binding domain of Phe-tRNA-synthetase-like protein
MCIDWSKPQMEALTRRMICNKYLENINILIMFYGMFTMHFHKIENNDI